MPDGMGSMQYIPCDMRPTICVQMHNRDPELLQGVLSGAEDSELSELVEVSN
jgi:hypothetical protein